MDEQQVARQPQPKHMTIWLTGLIACWMWTATWALAHLSDYADQWLVMVIPRCVFPFMVGFTVRRRCFLSGWIACCAATVLGPFTLYPWTEALALLPVWALLAAPFGTVFGALGFSCRRVSSRLAWTLIAVAWLTPVAVTVVTAHSSLKQMEARIVTRFPATQALGTPVAVTHLEPGPRLAWFALARDGRALHVYEGALHAGVECARVLAVPQSVTPLDRAVAQFAASTQWVAVSTRRGAVVWDHRDGRITHAIPAPPETQFSAIALSPTDEWVAYAFHTASPQLHLLNLTGPPESTSFRPSTTAPISAMTFSHDGDELIAGTGYRDHSQPSKGGEFVFVDTTTRRLARVHDARPYYSYSGREPRVEVIAVAEHPGDPASGRKRSFSAAINRRHLKIYAFGGAGGGRRGTLASLAYSNCGWAAARGFADGRVVVADVSPQSPFPDTDPFERPKNHTRRVWKCAAPVTVLHFLPDYRYLAANDVVLCLTDLLHPDSSRRGYWTRRPFVEAVLTPRPPQQ